MAYGHHAVPATVEHDAPADGEDGASMLMTAAQERNLLIPPGKQQSTPAGQDPSECFPEACRARDATVQDGDLTTRDQPAAAALPSTAPPCVEAPRPVVLFVFMCYDSI